MKTTQASSQHTSQMSFSPLQLLQWPLAPLMPAHNSSDFVSAGNKCPSFTVCRLIYSNYKSLCSREDNRIVWDESIKSLLSQAIISRYLAASVRSRAECAAHTRTHTHGRLLFDQTKSLFHPISTTAAITSAKHGGLVISTVASQEESPRFKSCVRRGVFLCGACMFSCLCGFPPQSQTCLLGRLQARTSF